MPHITVEYSDILTLDMPSMLTDLHNALASHETITLASIKTRAIPVQYSIVGDGQKADKMMHITLRLLPGREDSLKAEMAEDLAATARKHIADTRTSITCEVVELDAHSYVK